MPTSTWTATYTIVFVLAAVYLSRRMMASSIVGPLKCVTVSPLAAHTATVIFIHGLGDSGNGWKPVGDMFKADPALRHIKWIFPNAPIMPVTVNGGMEMPSWYDIMSFGLKEAEDEQGLLKSAKSIKELIESEMSSTGIDSKRIVVGGFSQGGVTALLSGLTLDKRLAGISSLSCYLPLREKFKSLANAELLDLPIFLAHGTHDPVIPFHLSTASVQALKGLGYSEAQSGSNAGVEYHTYSGLAHSTSSEELDDLRAWLKRAVPA